MYPFRDSVYITSKDIKTLNLPRSEGRRLSVVEDEAQKYKQLRKCYMEKYFGPDTVEEDRRFKNWQRWMEERKKVHSKLCRRTGRLPASLVMNSTEGRRLEEEMKSLLHYAQTIVKPDPLRGGPDFWKGPLMLPPPCRCMHPLEVHRPPEELGKIPVMEHVGIPVAVREEKGLFGFSEVPDVRKRWMRSDYLEHRASALRHKVLYLADHFPDTSMMVEGHAFGRDSGPSDEPNRSNLCQQDVQPTWTPLCKDHQVCPVDSAMLHWHNINAEQYHASQQQFSEEQWAHMATVAEYLGSVASGLFSGLNVMQRKRTTQPPVPPLLLVTPAPGPLDQPRNSRRPTGPLALAEGPETEIEPQLLVRLVIGSVILWREPPHPGPVAMMENASTLATDRQESLSSVGSSNKLTYLQSKSTGKVQARTHVGYTATEEERQDDDDDDGPKYHANVFPSWDMVFESPVGHRHTFTLKVENTGCMTVDVRWIQEQGPRINGPNGIQPQGFYLHECSGLCPPGQRLDLEVSFYPRSAGLYRESWLLRTNPRLAPPCARMRLRLWGLATEQRSAVYAQDGSLATETSATNLEADSSSDSKSFLLASPQSKSECPGRITMRLEAFEAKAKLLQLADELEREEKDLAEKVAAEQKARRANYDQPWPHATCKRADCKARAAVRQRLEPPWPLGPVTKNDINGYLDACIVRAELTTAEIKRKRFGRIGTPPPYRTLFVNEEVFEHLNPGYYYRAEPISRLQDLWKEATGGKGVEWDLKLSTLREKLLQPRQGIIEARRSSTPIEQYDLMDKMNEAVKELEKPPPSAVVERSGRAVPDPCLGARTCEGVRTCTEAPTGGTSALRRWGPGMSRGSRAAYAAAYAAICCFANAMHAEAQAIKVTLGISKPSGDSQGKRIRSRGLVGPSSTKVRKSRNTAVFSASTVSGMSIVSSIAPAGSSASSFGGGRIRSQSRNRRISARDLRLSNTTMGSGASDASSLRGTVADGLSDMDVLTVSPPGGGPSSADSAQRLQAQYLSMLYVKTYHLLGSAVEQLAAAIDSKELLNY